MAVKHTPGPWIRGRYGDLRGPDGKMVCLADTGLAFVSAYQNPEAVANTRLCHSAPELLEALFDCREALRRNGCMGELKVVEAAIAKATGEQR